MCQIPNSFQSNEEYFELKEQLDEAISKLQNYLERLEESKNIGSFTNLSLVTKHKGLDKLKPALFYRKNSRFKFLQPLVTDTATKKFNNLVSSFRYKLKDLVTLAQTENALTDPYGNEIGTEPVLSSTELKDIGRKILIDFYARAYKIGLESSGAGLQLQKKTPVWSIPELSHADKRWLLKSATAEQEFLSGLIDDIVTKSIVNKKYTADQRADMYVETLASQFEAGKVAGAPKYSLIHWKLNPFAETCPSCIFLEKHSPWLKDTLPTTPKAGLTSCRFNCKCNIIVEPVSANKYQAIKDTSITRGQAIQRLNSIFK